MIFYNVNAIAFPPNTYNRTVLLFESLIQADMSTKLNMIYQRYTYKSNNILCKFIRHIVLVLCVFNVVGSIPILVKPNT